MTKELNWKQHESSLIKRSAFNPDDNSIIVEYYNGGQRVHYGATPEMYDEFANAESVGKHYHAYIKHLKGEAVKK